MTQPPDTERRAAQDDDARAEALNAVDRIFAYVRSRGEHFYSETDNPYQDIKTIRDALTKFAPAEQPGCVTLTADEVDRVRDAFRYVETKALRWHPCDQGHALIRFAVSILNKGERA